MALWSEVSRGAITPQGPQILARPEDTKNDWLSQSLLRPLSIVFISRGICKHPWPMAACASLTSAVHTATNASCLPVTRRRNSRCAFPVFASSGQAGRKLRLPQLRQLSSARDTRQMGS
jgi:hypothetical protein